MIFKITEKMHQKIKDWDSCNPVDITGAKFAYTFIPTGLGYMQKGIRSNRRLGISRTLK